MNSDPFREQYRAELHHASVAVGINTSGLIDAAIFGKPACTIELPELRRGQGETIHFQHLKSGLLRTATSLEEHAATLAELVQRPTYEADEKSNAFVAMFVRPPQLDGSPTEIFVREMLQLCSRRGELEPVSGAKLAVGRSLATIGRAIDGRRRTVKRLRRAPRRVLHVGRRAPRRVLQVGRRAVSPLRRPLSSSDDPR
jgi:hypothetical protein